MRGFPPNDQPGSEAASGGKFLRVLIIEDNPDDVELMLRALRRGDFVPQWQCVTTEGELLDSLRSEFDVILADYSLPRFDGLRALQLLREVGCETPFILVSGTIGEERAVAAIKEGAADYLLKDRLTRLGASVTQALEQRRLREAQQRSQEHQRAREVAERANEAKTDFLARMSHELRTPLNAILGFGQLLEVDTLSEPQTESVGHIMKAGRHLLHLVNEVLDISSAESGSMFICIEEVDVSALVQETFALIHPLAAQRNVELHLCDPGGRRSPAVPDLFVLADRHRFRQVLLNLFSNAVKYNVTGGSVRVDCQCTVDRLCLRVTDTGPGIPADKFARLFTPFDRLGAEGTRVEGTGLGLALSKRLMEAMDGELRLERPSLTTAAVAETQTGAVFMLELPRAKNPAVPHEAKGTEASFDQGASASDFQRCQRC